MQVLVTGSNGFIGSTLVERLLQQGHSVRCLVRRSSDLTWLEDLQVEYVYADLTDAPALGHVVSDVERIYHLAGVTKARDEAEYFKGNYEVTLRLLEACKSYGPEGQRFIYVSSQAAAGPSHDFQPVHESDPAQPISIYGRAKNRAEAAVLAYAGERWATIVRPPSVYGPRDRDVYVYFRSVAKGLLLLLGDGTQKVSLVYVDDLVGGIILAGESAQARGKTYFLSADGAYDWQTIGTAIAKALNKKPLVVRVPSWLLTPVAFFSVLGARITKKPALLNWDKVAEMRQPAWLCSNERAKTELGFKPQVGLDEGIARAAAWYREMGWL
jgi:dihydroflavonol-4-reductase